MSKGEGKKQMVIGSGPPRQASMAAMGVYHVPVAQLIPRQASEKMGRPLGDMITTKKVSSVESGEVGFREITKHGVIDTSGI